MTYREHLIKKYGNAGLLVCPHDKAGSCADAGMFCGKCLDEEMVVEKKQVTPQCDIKEAYFLPVHMHLDEGVVSIFPNPVIRQCGEYWLRVKDYLESENRMMQEEGRNIKVSLLPIMASFPRSGETVWISIQDYYCKDVYKLIRPGRN